MGRLPTLVPTGQPGAPALPQLQDWCTHICPPSPNFGPWTLQWDWGWATEVVLSQSRGWGEKGQPAPSVSR